MQINIEDFVAGAYEQQYQYKSFFPKNINLQWVLSDPEILTLMEKANRLLGELNAFSQLIPNVDFFIQMHITKEATTSSRIEGTQTNMEEALFDEQDINPENRDDWQEVQNYVKAINYAVNELERLPLSNRLFKETHRILMQGVRGKRKLPGEYRTSQNWIGLSLKNATFVPPHHEHIAGLMSDLEHFIHNEEIHVPHLIKIAIIHYQFETIHPFLDGNGRLGRLLIVLYLVEKKLIAKPALYLSDFFERHKTDYYDHLMAVRTHSQLTEWVKFFMFGMCETAEKSINVFKDILALKEKLERAILPKFHVRRQENVQKLMEYLYQQPVINIKDVSESLNIQKGTANKLVADFTKLEILREMTGRKRNKIYIFNDYVKLFLE